MAKAKIKLGRQGQGEKKTGSSRLKVRIIVGLILVSFLALGSLSVPQPWNAAASWVSEKTPANIPAYWDVPFRLGLDLQGGTHLVYEADLSEVDPATHEEAIEGVRDVIERRVNAFGVAEPKVQTTKSGETWRVIVELAGISDVNQAIQMIGETPILEFKEQGTVKELTGEEPEYQLVEAANAEERAAAMEIRDRAASGEDFTMLMLEFSDDALSLQNDGDTGWVNSNDYYAPIIDQYLKEPAPYAGMILPDVYELQKGFYVIKVLDTAREGSEIEASHILICYEGALRCEETISQDEAWNQINDLKNQATPENFAELATEYSIDRGSGNHGGELGWFGPGDMVEQFETAAFGLANGTISDIIETDFGYHIIYKTNERPLTEYHFQEIVMPRSTINDFVDNEEWVNSELSGKHLSSARVEFNQNTGVPHVSLQFNSEGDQLFGEITERNVGRPVAIFLDGSPISIPTVQEAIYGGQAVITGSFTVDEAKLLAQRLNAGALPVPIEIISQQTVGPSLGQMSTEKSLKAGLIGFLLIALFMLIYYRLPGLIAIKALLVYGVVVLAIFKLLPVTLTLAGLAGFVLSLGMAVDANVLIFERLKEELKSGRPFESAIDEGFRRAWSSIRDGNLTTLIACLILYWFSSSFIQGFALTLGIGVLTSMFTAIFVTRILLKLVAGWSWARNLSLFGVKNTKTDL